MNNARSALSEPFADRLGQLKPDQVIRAVVTIDTELKKKDPTRRMTDQERRNAISAMREVAQPVLAEIDWILEDFQGKRLDEKISVLGTVLVEATAACILGLSLLPKVKAIVEDQPIHPIKPIAPKD